MPYTCNECGGTYCSDHRLPEKHVCSLNRVTLDVRRSTRVLSYLFLPLVLLWMALRWLFRPKLLALGVAALVLVSATAGTGVPVVDRTVDDGLAVGADFAEYGAGFAGTIVGNVSESLNHSDGYNVTKIEREIHRLINKKRAEHGLSRLSFDTKLREVARYHSQNMAEKQFFDHTAPSGQTMEDRYQKFGYSCRVSSGGNRYLTGAENIAYRGGDIYSSEKELAEFFVDSWMDSPGHRKNILTPAWEKEGIGVAVTEVGGDTKVYATQNFC
jgi:uncharacterized protein YkwD